MHRYINRVTRSFEARPSVFVLAMKDSMKDFCLIVPLFLAILFFGLAKNSVGILPTPLSKYLLIDYIVTSNISVDNDRKKSKANTKIRSHIKFT